jgi:hypothetical protein
MHVTIQNMIYLMARAFSRCQEHEGRETSSPKVRGCRSRKKMCLSGTVLSVEFPSRVLGFCG